MKNKSGYRNGILIYPVSIVDHKKQDESGGGGLTPGVPIPADTVDTNAIIDGAVQEQDLNDSVKDRMTVTHDSSTGGLRLGGYAKPGNVPANNSQDVGQGGGEDSDDETGFENGAVDGENDI